MEALQILVKNMEKKDIRKQVFAQRAKTSEAFVQQQSSLIAGKIFALPQFQDASCIYVYMDYNKEASTRPIIEEAWRLGKKVAAPKVFGEDMRYFYIHSYDDVAPGYFNIPEPDETRNLEEAADETALLLVPGVAFDKDRHRCGYGKGFYDRFLAAHPGFTTVAAAFEFQLFDAVPFEETDILPQMLVTEQKIYR